MELQLNCMSSWFCRELHVKLTLQELITFALYLKKIYIQYITLQYITFQYIIFLTDYKRKDISFNFNFSISFPSIQIGTLPTITPYASSVI